MYHQVWHSEILRPAHTVYLCVFLWISEQTAIISVHIINWLVFITEMECVYCAVRAESLNVTRCNFRLSRVNVECINIHYNRTKFSNCDATDELVKASRPKVFRSLTPCLCSAMYRKSSIYSNNGDDDIKYDPQLVDGLVMSNAGLLSICAEFWDPQRLIGVCVCVDHAMLRTGEVFSRVCRLWQECTNFPEI